METGQSVRDLHGDKAYQQHAQAALPLLVRQAHAGAKISYARLAEELGMPNPRNLNRVLGSVGTTLQQLTKPFGEKVPPIQCLVVNQRTGLPGHGVGWFIHDVVKFRALTRRRQHAIVERELADVFAFTRWNEVLTHLGLKPKKADFGRLIEKAASFRAGGESEEHKRLKRYVAAHPEILKLSPAAAHGEQEKDLPSGDSLDVFFHHASIRTAAEVKSELSPKADLVRGLFQCVKYRAVLGAMIATEGSEDSAEAVLVYEGQFPEDLKPLRNILDVKVFDNVKPR
jgi:hypothetical protein